MAARACLLALMLASCLDPMDRELTECHPDCHADGGVSAGDARPIDGAADDASANDAEPIDASDAGDLDAQPMDATPLANLEASEVTPHQITWEWGPDAVPADVVAYRLRVATRLDLIESAEPWDAEDDANLGQRVSPFGPGTVHRTRMLDLTPSTAYFARLYGLREGMNELPLAEGTGTTHAEPELAMVLFANELPPESTLDGFRDPATAAVTYEGTGALWFEAPTVTAASLASMMVVPPLLGEGWGGAYLEMFMRVVPERELPFVEIGLSFGEINPIYTYFAFPAVSRWNRIEVPLTAYAPMLIGDHLNSFSVRSPHWGDATSVFVDAVVIRY